MSEVLDENYKSFQCNIFAHSSPKPALKSVKRKCIIQNISSDDDCGKQPRLSKKKRCEPIYGPVNTDQSWVKMRCRREDADLKIGNRILIHL